MSIQTTRIISRNNAQRRIEEITKLIQNKEYKKLEVQSYEPTCSLVEAEIPSAILQQPNINKLKHNQIKDIMNSPFYRYSMFDNYEVEN